MRSRYGCRARRRSSSATRCFGLAPASFGCARGHGHSPRAARLDTVQCAIRCGAAETTAWDARREALAVNSCPRQLGPLSWQWSADSIAPKRADKQEHGAKEKGGSKRKAGNHVPMTDP